MDGAKNARALKRIGKELEQLQGAGKLEFATVELKDKTELLVWKVVLLGPAGSPYDKGKFTVELDLRGGYPFKHPGARFETKVYHPNVNREDGSVCEEMLSRNWSPETQIKVVLQQLFDMLLTPDGDSPVDEEITRQFKEKPKDYAKTAAEWTKKYASK